MDTKTRIDYEVMTSNDVVICVALSYREGRLPLTKAIITQYGEVVLTGQDGKEEVLGAPNHPCPIGVLDKLRSHHEGLLFVEFSQPGQLEDVPAGGPAREQMVRAVFPKIG